MTSSNLVLRGCVLLGIPLALTVLMLFHPSPYSDLADELVPIAGWRLAIHTLQFVLFAFMGVAVWLLTDGLRGVSMVVSRVSAVIFAIFYDIRTFLLTTLWLEFDWRKRPSGEDVSYSEASPAPEMSLR